MQQRNVFATYAAQDLALHCVLFVVKETGDFGTAR